MQQIFRSHAADHKVHEKANGTEHKCQEQAGYHEVKWDTVLFAVFKFPATDEKVECEIMNPTRQHGIWIREQLHYAVKAAKASFGFSKIKNNEGEVKSGQNQGDNSRHYDELRISPAW